MLVVVYYRLQDVIECVFYVLQVYACDPDQFGLFFLCAHRRINNSRAARATQLHALERFDLLDFFEIDQRDNREK